jgi:cytochrome P450
MTPLPLLADAAFHDDPYPLYAALRERAGRSGLLCDDTLNLWVACSANAVEAALAHPTLRVRPSDEPVPRPLQGTPAGRLFGGLMRMNDGSAHAAAKPPVVAMLAHFGDERVEAASRRCASAPRSSEELDEALFDAPLALLAELFDVPLARRAALIRDVRCVVDGWSPRAKQEQRRAAQPAADALLALFDGQANRVGLFTQTCEATAALIGQTLIALQRDPSLWPQLGDEGLRDALLSEVARHDAPIQNTRRFVAEQTTLCGHTLQPGDAVLVLLASANRDAARFAEPDRFDARRGSACFTWGAATHACPGARLSRSIAGVLIQAWRAHGCALSEWTAQWRYRPSPNARLPRFTA